MEYDPIEEEYEEHIQDSHGNNETDEIISSVDPTNEWSEWRANLAANMFNEWMVNIEAEKSTKRHWELHEDNVLVSCMVDLYNMGSYNADTGFKAGYLNKLERMMGEKLPNSGLKAQPHIISRIKTLKKE
ncbi:hypothetical protein Ancab_019486 [Ancistrocladus abbreviatus]